MNIETLDTLPGEGEVETTTQRRVRRSCDLCGEPAHKKVTYLLPNYRSNPASAAYGRDDCSWCEDAAVFVCRTCRPEAPVGFPNECSTFPATERFAHMFLIWVKEPS